MNTQSVYAMKSSEPVVCSNDHSPSLARDITANILIRKQIQWVLAWRVRSSRITWSDSGHRHKDGYSHD
jgi:hypothetical protein